MKYQRYEIAGLVERPSWWKVRVKEMLFCDCKNWKTFNAQLMSK